MSNADDAQRRDVVPRKDDEGANLPADSKISLGSNFPDLDLSGLTPEQVQELKMRHAEGKIDLTNAAHRKSADVHAMDAQLRSMADNTTHVSESGQSVTITNTQENELGRTEIIMGTSEAAKRGKLSRSQTGAPDMTLVWAGLGALVVIAVVLMVIFGGG